MLLSMKAYEILNLLLISRRTLHVYATTGKIRYTVMPNGYYDYNDEDVYKLLNRNHSIEVGYES
jgi:predicted site-specific integrase-resolvase